MPGFARAPPSRVGVRVRDVSTATLDTAGRFPLRGNGAPGFRPLRVLIVDLTNGDIVEWLWLGGDVTELFDVAVIANVRCPRGLGPAAAELAEVVRAEGMEGQVVEEGSGVMVGAGRGAHIG